MTDRILHSTSHISLVPLMCLLTGNYLLCQLLQVVESVKNKVTVLSSVGSISVSVETLQQSNKSSMGSSELAVSIPLSAVSIIAYVLALGVLLYYKMWRSFIYRLVLYMFISLIFFSVSGISYSSVTVLLQEAREVNTTTSGYNSTLGNDTAVYTFLDTLMTSSLATAHMFVTCITVCIYLMALHNYQFTYKSDLCLLVFSILYLMIVIILTVIWRELNYYDKRGVTILNIFALPFLVNIVFTALTLVPLCCRACGYNLCMKTAATIESHRKALREVLPFFILIVPSFLVIVVWIVWCSILSGFIGGVHNIDADFNDILSALVAIGLLNAVCFALHLFFIRKNLRKLQGKKKASRTVNYNQHRTHRTTVYTSKGISETCNTVSPLLNESEEDTRYLLRKSNQST